MYGFHYDCYREECASYAQALARHLQLRLWGYNPGPIFEIGSQDDPWAETEEEDE